MTPPEDSVERAQHIQEVTLKALEVIYAAARQYETDLPEHTDQDIVLSGWFSAIESYQAAITEWLRTSGLAMTKTTLAEVVAQKEENVQQLEEWYNRGSAAQE